MFGFELVFVPLRFGAKWPKGLVLSSNYTQTSAKELHWSAKTGPFYHSVFVCVCVCEVSEWEKGAKRGVERERERGGERGSGREYKDGLANKDK